MVVVRSDRAFVMVAVGCVGLDPMMRSKTTKMRGQKKNKIREHDGGGVTSFILKQRSPHSTLTLVAHLYGSTSLAHKNCSGT